MSESELALQRVSDGWSRLASAAPVSVAAAAVQAPILALLYPLDTYKTRLQIPFGERQCLHLNSDSKKFRSVPPFGACMRLYLVRGCGSAFVCKARNLMRVPAF